MGGPVSRLPRPAGRTPAGRGYEKLSSTRGRRRPGLRRRGTPFASRITFADSTFLRLIITTHDRTDLRIAAPSLMVQRVLTLTGADQVLRIHSTIDDARTA